jgi:hypothetical protein
VGSVCNKVLSPTCGLDGLGGLMQSLRPGALLRWFGCCRGVRRRCQNCNSSCAVHNIYLTLVQTGPYHCSAMLCRHHHLHRCGTLCQQRCNGYRNCPRSRNTNRDEGQDTATSSRENSLKTTFLVHTAGCLCMCTLHHRHHTANDT